MTYLGNTPSSQNFTSGTDYFNGNGATTVFALTRSVNSVNDIEVVVNNVAQQPNTAYTVSGSVLTFTGAPSTGTGNIYVRYLSTNQNSIAPSPGTVGYAQLNADMQSKFAMKNRIINGAMVIDQRYAGTSIGVSGAFYTIDRWFINSVGGTPRLTIQQNAGSVTPPAGFTNYLGITSSGAYTPTSTEYYQLAQNIEGYNIADLGWGTANAKTITVSFWVYSSLTGQFGGAIRNATNYTYTYPFSFTVNTANTWQQVSITVVGPNASQGVWNTNNTSGMQLVFDIGSGSTFLSTAGSWQSGVYCGVTGDNKLVSTNGATFYITGVQLEVGSSATNFEYRQYGTELALCQRYYEAVGWQQRGTGTNASGVGFYTNYSVAKRAVPTVTLTGVNYIYGLTAATASVTAFQGGVEIFATSAGGAYAFSGTYNASAEL